MLVALTGCQIGPRPTLGPEPTEIGDAATEAVLVELETAETGPYTATYEIRPTRGETTTATVTWAGADTGRVAIGATEYVIDASGRQTCNTETQECRPGIDAQPISDLAIAPEFYGGSAATRLRRDAAIRVGPTTGSEDQIAGQPAICVAVPIEDTASVFCAVRGGPLARWRTTDVTIELTSFDPG